METEQTARRDILVVEDEGTLRRILQFTLGKQHSVRTAANGEEALERVAERLPDLIVSDIMMPRMDGFALLHALKSHPETRVIPFIFLTAKKDRMSRLRALRAGVDDYITKPFDLEHLIVRVSGLLERVAYYRGQATVHIGQRTVMTPKEAARIVNEYVDRAPNNAATDIAWDKLVAAFETLLSGAGRWGWSADQVELVRDVYAFKVLGSSMTVSQATELVLEFADQVGFRRGLIDDREDLPASYPQMLVAFSKVLLDKGVESGLSEEQLSQVRSLESTLLGFDEIEDVDKEIIRRLGGSAKDNDWRSDPEIARQVYQLRMKYGGDAMRWARMTASREEE